MVEDSKCNFFTHYVNQGKQSISLEPGGQFELSGAPLETLHQTCAEVNSHLYQVSFTYLL
jgi:gamma-glutamylcysteine synthetase